MHRSWLAEVYVEELGVEGQPEAAWYRVLVGGTIPEVSGALCTNIRRITVTTWPMLTFTEENSDHVAEL